MANSHIDGQSRTNRRGVYYSERAGKIPIPPSGVVERKSGASTITETKLETTIDRTSTAALMDDTHEACDLTRWGESGVT